MKNISAALTKDQIRESYRRAIQFMVDGLGFLWIVGAWVAVRGDVKADMSNQRTFKAVAEPTFPNRRAPARRSASLTGAAMALSLWRFK